MEPHLEPPLKLVWPAAEYLDSHVEALQKGWHNNTFATEEIRRTTLSQIEEDPHGYLASLVDREAKGDHITLPDGTTAARLPGYHRWMWDGAFCGSISFRWQKETSELPPHVLGHIGYSVVSWKQRRGYATEALRLMLPEASREGLAYVLITTDPENVASRRVIESNGGVLQERLSLPAAYGEGELLRYRVDL